MKKSALISWLTAAIITLIGCSTENQLTEQHKKRDSLQHTVIFNFATKQLEQHQVHPRINRPVVFHIKNINRYAYDVSITSRDSILAMTEFPEGFQFREQPKPEEEPIDMDEEGKKSSDKPSTINTANIDSSPTQKDIKQSLEAVNVKIELQSLITELQKRVLDINDSIRKNTYAGNLFAREVERLKKEPKSDSIDKEIEKTSDLKLQAENNVKFHIVSLNDYETKLKETKDRSTLVEIKNLTIKQYQQQFSSLQKAYDEVVTYYRRVWYIFIAERELTALARDPFLTPEKFKKCVENPLLHIPDLEQLSDFRNSVEYFFNKREDFKITYALMRRDIRSSDLSGDVISSIEAPAQDLRASVERMAEIVKQKNPIRIIDKLAFFMAVLSDPKSYSMTSAPIQPSQDLVLFEIAISKRPDNTDNRRQEMHFTDATNFPYREFVTGGLRYDFSTGIVFSFLINDYNYRTESVGADSVKILRDKRINHYLPSICGMFHASIRSWRQVTVGFTLGASIGTADLDINSIFPGISLMIGKSEKFIFTAGPALKKVKYLRSDFELNKNYAATKIAADVPTDNAFRIGAFVGVSYNLTKKQKDGFKIVR